MRVLVDAHMVGGRETGNETYIVNLLSHMAELPGVECAAAVMPDAKLPAVLYDTNIELLPLRPSGNWFRLGYTLPAMCQHWRADILHVTYVGPFFLSCPLIVTVHDVAFERYPQFFSLRDRLLFATLLRLTLRRANAVITVSKHAKQEILEVFPSLDGKVYVTMEAASTSFRPVSDSDALQAVRSRCGIRSEFVLAVGNLQPRKNLLRLIRAFASVRRQVESIQLVIVGKAQWQSSSVYRAVKDLGLERDVVFTGYVSDEDLILLYSSAKLFVYPSIYEGFGLPILEAMACGTPVITSNTSSMPEVAGDAAILVNPTNVDEISEAMQTILSDTELQHSLRIKGLEQTRCFSWDRTARETLGVYKLVLESNRTG